MNKETKKTVIVLAGIAVFIALSSSLLSSVEIDAEISHRVYCEDVSIWELDAELGIEPNQRGGAPNYKGVNCEQ